MTKLTKLEALVIKGILGSEYGDGTVDKQCWSWSANKGFANPKQFSGAVSSCSKKGYVVAQNYEGGNDPQYAYLTLTQAGYDAYNAKLQADVPEGEEAPGFDNAELAREKELDAKAPQY